MIRRPPRSTPRYSSAASDVYKRQFQTHGAAPGPGFLSPCAPGRLSTAADRCLSLIHISEPTRHLRISYAVFCLKKKTTKKTSSPKHSQKYPRLTLHTTGLITHPLPANSTTPT